MKTNIVPASYNPGCPKKKKKVDTEKYIDDRAETHCCFQNETNRNQFGLMNHLKIMPFKWSSLHCTHWWSRFGTSSLPSSTYSVIFSVSCVVYFLRSFNMDEHPLINPKENSLVEKLLKKIMICSHLRIVKLYALQTSCTQEPYPHARFVLQPCLAWNSVFSLLRATLILRVKKRFYLVCAAFGIHYHCIIFNNFKEISHCYAGQWHKTPNT